MLPGFGDHSGLMLYLCLAWATGSRFESGLEDLVSCDGADGDDAWGERVWCELSARAEKRESSNTCIIERVNIIDWDRRRCVEYTV